MTRMARKRQPIEQTYSPEEVADFCRVHRRTVYRWLSDGTLLASKAGPRTWVITQTQLNAFLAPGAAGKKQPKPQPEKQPATQPEEKQQPEEKPLENSEGRTVAKPDPAAAGGVQVVQPELPAEMLPTSGRAKYTPVPRLDDLDEAVLPPYGSWEAVGLLPGANVLLPEMSEKQQKPDVPETWRGSKRRKRRK